MAYVIYKDPSSFYVFARQVGTASQINPNRIVENQPSYVISAIKEQIRLCSTINLDLTSTHTTVDGVSLENSDRVLLVGQIAPYENGVYFWDAGHQMFFRSQDCFNIKSGFLVAVTEGVAEKDSVWMLTTEDPIEVDTTPIYFVKITSTAFHAATHLYAGIDAIDGNQVGIDYVPLNYVRDTSGPLVSDVHHLTAHIQGIDISLGGVGAPHASTHVRLGTDQIDGDILDIDYVPVNYVRDTSPPEVTNVEHLTAHLAGLDDAFGNLRSTAIAQVDPTRSDAIDDSNLDTPFITVQGAVDAVSPTGGIVEIYAPGPYDETVYIRYDNIRIVGKVGQGRPGGPTAQIRPSSGPALVITNATLNSIVPWVNSGPANYDLNYGLLIADVQYPWDIQIENVDFYPATNTEYPVVIVGVGVGTSFGGNELRWEGCSLRSNNNSLSVWARLSNYLVFEGQCWLAGLTKLHNIAGMWVNNSQISTVGNYYNVADDEPSDTGNYGLNGHFVMRGSLNLTGSARAGYDKLFQPFVEGTVNCDDTSRCNMEGGFVGTDVDCEQDAAITFIGTHVTGDLNFDTGGADPACSIRGGGYLGTLTDPGSRFTYTKYIALSTETSDGIAGLYHANKGGAWAARPVTNLYDGRMYFDTGLTKSFWYNTGDTTWYDAAGAPHP